ncbi:hypothetical protein [Rhodococcus sp. NPDC003383]
MLLEDFGEPAGADGFVVELLAEGSGGGEVPKRFLALEELGLALQMIKDLEELCACLCAACGGVGFEEELASLGVLGELDEQRL